MKFFVLTSLVCFCLLDAKEFLYPVGYHPERKVVFVIYQKTATHLELWEWDPRTKYAHQLLLSRYSPVSFTFLPDYSGFSFIDNGILKVKQLVKRSPRTIEYDGPIYNVEQVHWIDTKTCYASGKYRDYFGLFHIDWDGVIQPLLFTEGTDYQYPQKVGDILFFIEQTKKNYKIRSMKYSIDFDERGFEEKMSSPQNHVTQELIDFGVTPLAFLQMVSQEEGYVLSHPAVVSRKSEVIEFSYHKIVKVDDLWQSSLLFSFTIPTPFLMRGENRLFESILPLLPVVSTDFIYYVDVVNRNALFLSLCSYDKVTGEKRILTETQQHHFGVKETGLGTVFGGEIGGVIGMTEGVRIELGRQLIS